jgi:hypothetical protein
VWIVGHVPPWVTRVNFIPGNRTRSKWLNVHDNLRLACQHVTSERFVVMNDDFYVMQPVESVPSWHRGPLRKHIAMQHPGDWKRSLETTYEWCVERGIDEPLSYELHVPVVMERDKLGEVLELTDGFRIPPQWRTIYGNFWRVPSEPMRDCRIRHTNQKYDGPFLSTDDRVFHSFAVGREIRRIFRTPSPYERLARG